MKLRLQRKKRVKGMTLVEIIIAMVVFSVTALVMAEVGSAAVKFTKNANHVDRRTSIEKPLAENAASGSSDITTVNDNLKISVSIGGRTTNIKGECYSTGAAVTAADRADSFGNADLKFVKIDTSKTSGNAVWVEPST